MGKVFIDVDIILDLMISRGRLALDAARIFSLSEKKEISLCTTGSAFSDASYILKKLGTPKKVMEKLVQLAGLVEITGLPDHAILPENVQIICPDTRPIFKKQGVIFGEIKMPNL